MENVNVNADVMCDAVFFSDVEEVEKMLRNQKLALEERSIETIINEGDEYLLEEFFSVDERIKSTDEYFWIELSLYY